MGDLAAARAPLIGRAVESARLASLLRPGGPVVIDVTGPRGVGKSALIDAVLERSEDRFGVVQHLELADAVGGDIVSAIRRHITMMPLPFATVTGKRSLLVIHRGDQLAPHAAELVELAAGDGALTILVESVAEIRGVGCVCVPVAPLDPPAAARLLRRFADAVGVPLAEDAATKAHVDRICASVDCNPLAIELAARRLPLIALADLDALLESPQRALGLLTMSVRAGSFRDAIRESQQPSSVPAQRLLELLSVFTGSFALDAVEALSEGVVTPCFDALGELLDLRLVELDPAAAAGRYRLSRLVRAFAAERLAASGNEDAARDRHARHYENVARRAALAVDDADEETARVILGEDLAECLEAHRRLLGRDAGRALRLAADLGWEAQRRGSSPEVTRALRSARASESVEDARTRRDALIWLVQLESYAPDAHDKAEIIGASLSEALALARDIGEPLPLLMALRSQFLAVNALRDPVVAIQACHEGIARASEMGHTRWISRFEISLASMLGNLHQYEAAAEHARSGLERAMRADDRRTVVHAVLTLHGLPGGASGTIRDVPSLESVLSMSRELDDLQREAHVLAALALREIERGEASAAASWISQRQRNLRRVDLLNGLTVSVMLAVMITALRGDFRTGARLNGAITAHVESLLALAAPQHSAAFRRAVDTIRANLRDDEFDRVTGEGRALDRDATRAALLAYVEEVRESASTTEAASAEAGAGPSLTAREHQVLELLSRGLRNKEIAAQLRITPKSVMHHTVAIYRKLGVRGRAEAATLATRVGLVAPE